MKSTIAAAITAALLITIASEAHARGGWGGVVGGIIAGAIIAQTYRHHYRPRLYRPRTYTPRRPAPAPRTQPAMM
jgi:hypothetical protein